MVKDRTEDSLFSPLVRQVEGFSNEVQAMFRARAELLGLELQAARSTATRVIVSVLLGLFGLVVTIPIVVVALAWQIARWFDLDLLVVLWVATGMLLVVSVGLILLAWRRYRRDFHGLEDSIAELREDMLWMQEWVGKKSADSADPGEGEAVPDPTEDQAAVPAGDER